MRGQEVADDVAVLADGGVVAHHLAIVPVACDRRRAQIRDYIWRAAATPPLKRREANERETRPFLSQSESALGAKPSTCAVVATFSSSMRFS